MPGFPFVCVPQYVRQGCRGKKCCCSSLAVIEERPSYRNGPLSRAPAFCGCCFRRLMTDKTSTSAHAMNSTLGKLCTAADDSCVDSSSELACDDVTGQCRIRHGQACSADNTSLCVSGAECTVGTNPSEQLCMCRPPVYTPDTTSGKCIAPEGKCGGACADDDECDTGMFCSNNVCSCFLDKYLNLTTGICDVNREAETQEWSFKIGGQVQLGAVAIGGVAEFSSGANDVAASATVFMLGAILGILISP